MTETVYMDRLPDMGRKTVSTMGQQPGPVGGDGWSVISEVPTSLLQSSHHYAFLVTGKIGNFRLAGSGAASGLVQLCLGDASGTKSPIQLMQVPVTEQLGEREGIPFSFLLIFSAAWGVVDPVWGASWPNTAALRLYGRGWWRSDLPTYTVSWDVTDLAWIWIDLDAIPLADQMVAVNTTAANLAAGPGWTNLAQASGTPGTNGDVWVHFWSAYYVPGLGSTPAFQAGYATGGGFAGFTARNGTSGKLGYGRTASVSGAQFHLGTFWVEGQQGATYYPALRGRDMVSGLVQTQFRRWACVSVRLTNLEAVVVSSSNNEPNLTSNFPTELYGSRFYALELVNSRSIAPWVFATAQVDGYSQRRSFGIWATSNLNELLLFTQQHEQSIGPNEQMAAFAFGERLGLGPSATEIQYRLRVMESGGTVPMLVRDLYLLTFYPVRDPDNIPIGVPAVSADVEIAPGKESLGVGSLLDPPLVPDMASGESQNWTRERLESATAYVRTWGVWMAPRRSWSLSWSPVNAADRDALLAFFAANVAFRILPLRAAAKVPVVPIRDPVVQQMSAQTWRVDLEVAELIYTGP